MLMPSIETAMDVNRDFQFRKIWLNPISDKKNIPNVVKHHMKNVQSQMYKLCKFAENEEEKRKTKYGKSYKMVPSFYRLMKEGYKKLFQNKYFPTNSEIKLSSYNKIQENLSTAIHKNSLSTFNGEHYVRSEKQMKNMKKLEIVTNYTKERTPEKIKTNANRTTSMISNLKTAITSTNMMSEESVEVSNRFITRSGAWRKTISVLRKFDNPKSLINIETSPSVDVGESKLTTNQNFFSTEIDPNFKPGKFRDRSNSVTREKGFPLRSSLHQLHNQSPRKSVNFNFAQALFRPRNSVISLSSEKSQSSNIKSQISIRNLSQFNLAKNERKKVLAEKCTEIMAQNSAVLKDLNLMRNSLKNKKIKIDFNKKEEKEILKLDVYKRSELSALTNLKTGKTDYIDAKKVQLIKFTDAFSKTSNEFAVGMGEKQVGEHYEKYQKDLELPINPKPQNYSYFERIDGNLLKIKKGLYKLQVKQSKK
jgi:hypothetical protein